MLPIVALLGFVLARRLIRPINPVIDAARPVGQGDLTVNLPDRSRDEYGELARRFNEMAAALRAKDDELRRTNEETTELLLSALPRRLVEQFTSIDPSKLDALTRARVHSHAFQASWKGPAMRAREARSS